MTLTRSHSDSCRIDKEVPTQLSVAYCRKAGQNPGAAVAPKELFNSFSTRRVSLGISSIPSPRASYSLNSKSVWAIATYVYDRRVLGKLVVSKASAW